MASSVHTTFAYVGFHGAIGTRCTYYARHRILGQRDEPKPVARDARYHSWDSDASHGGIFISFTKFVAFLDLSSAPLGLF